MNSEYIKKWVGYLNSVDREMGRIAAEKLGNAGNNGVVPDLIKALTNRPSEIRAAAARALGHIGDPASVPALAELLKDDDFIVSSAAAEALGELRHRSAVPALREILRENRAGAHFERTRPNDRGLSVVVVHALERIGTVDALEAIRKYGGS
jgi:HEAT repeat protein